MQLGRYILLTLKELWTSVSSRSITMHFLSASFGLTSGNRAFWGALEDLLLSGGSPEDELLPPPWTPPASLSFVLFFELLFLPKQQIMEHKKLDRFFGGSIMREKMRNRNLFMNCRMNNNLVKIIDCKKIIHNNFNPVFLYKIIQIRWIIKSKSSSGQPNRSKIRYYSVFDWTKYL